MRRISMHAVVSACLAIVAAAAVFAVTPEARSAELASLPTGPPGGVYNFYGNSVDTDPVAVPELPANVMQVAVGKADVSVDGVSIDNYNPDSDTCRCKRVWPVRQRSWLQVALMSDGTVRTWGSALQGQLGDGTNLPDGPAVDPGQQGRRTPQPVPGLTGVAQVSAGFASVLALKSDGTVWAWGDNSYGQAGPGAPAPGEGNAHPSVTTPVQVTGLPAVVQISAGDGFGIALAADGSVWVWGNGLWDTPGPRQDRRTPARVPVLANVAQVEAGYHHALALDSAGRVWGWGFSPNGQAGTHRTLGGNPMTFGATPLQIPGLPAGVSQIAAGFHRSYAIAGSDRSVWAWGGGGFLPGLNPNDVDETGHHDDDRDQHGWVSGPTGMRLTYTYDQTNLNNNEPLEISAATRTQRIFSRAAGAVQISANYGAFGVVLADGTVWDWDVNADRSGGALVQEPAAIIHGTTQIAIAAAGSSSNISLSLATRVAVPAVTGLSQSAAVDAIRMAGLTVGRITQEPGFPVSTVVAQNPPANTGRTPGDAVAITVLAGAGVQVPNVLGLTETAAIAALDAAGLGHTVTRVQDCSNPGKIVDQNPPGGTVTPSSTTVRITRDTGTTRTCDF
jgi:alpha-tubulin suppressor-like RCC1 family protein